MSQTNNWPINAVIFKELSGHVFEICFLTNFGNSGLIGISYIPHKEILMKTRNTIGLDAMIVLLRDSKSVVMTIWYIKLHCKSVGPRVMIFSFTIKCALLENGY